MAALPALYELESLVQFDEIYQLEYICYEKHLRHCGYIAFGKTRADEYHPSWFALSTKGGRAAFRAVMREKI